MLKESLGLVRSQFSRLTVFVKLHLSGLGGLQQLLPVRKSILLQTVDDPDEVLVLLHKLLVGPSGGDSWSVGPGQPHAGGPPVSPEVELLVHVPLVAHPVLVPGLDWILLSIELLGDIQLLVVVCSTALWETT